MTFAELAVERPEAFALLVARLRKLGVVRIDGLELGPEPVEHARRLRSSQPPGPLADAERRHATMFAASSIRPPLPKPVTPPDGAPRAVVQRRARVEGARDGSETGSTREG